MRTKTVSPEKIRVLHIVNWLVRGGIEVLLAQLTEALSSRYQFDFLCKGKNTGEMAFRVETLGANVFHCPMDLLQRRMASRFRALLRERRYDVVHAYCADLNGTFLRIAKEEGVPVRVSEYQNAFINSKEALIRKMPFLAWPRAAYLRKYRAMGFASATDIVGCSHAVIQSRVAPYHPRAFSTVIHNGIDLSPYGQTDRRSVRAELGIPEEVPVIGHVGRFSTQKNHEGLLEVAKRIIARNSDTRFLLVGDGFLRPLIENSVSKAGLESHFVFAGIRDDVPRLLAAMDLFLFPSLWEGFGIVVAEAQAAGVPCVTSTLSSVREALHPLYHPYMAEATDYDALAESCLRLLEHTSRDPSMQEQAKQWVVDHLSIETCLKKRTDLYEHRLENPFSEQVHLLEAHDHRHIHSADDGEYYDAGPLHYDPFYKEPLAVFDSVTVITRTKKVEGPPLPSWYPVTGPGVRVHPIREFNSVLSLLFLLPHQLREVWKAVRQADVVWARLPSFTGWFCALAACLQKKPFGTTRVGIGTQGKLPRFMHPLVRLWDRIGRIGMSRAAAESYVARFLADAYSKAPHEAFIFSTVNMSDSDYRGPELRPSRNKQVFRLVTTVNLIEAKGVMDLLDAARILRDTWDRKFHLRIVGEGPLRNRMETYLHEENLQDAVALEGYVGDRSSLLAMIDHADLYVFPSHTEGMPRSVIEACARAIPIVSTDLAGIRELVEPRWLVPPHEPERMADKIIEAYNEYELARADGAHAYRKSKDFRDDFLLEKKLAFWSALRARANK